MYIKRFFPLLIIFIGSYICANEPSGALLLNNNTNWRVLVEYKDRDKKIQKIPIDREKQGIQISISDVFKNQFIIIKHNDLYVPFKTKPPRTYDGRSIIDTINQNKSRLKGQDVLIATIALKNNQIDVSTQILTREEYNEQLRKAQVAFPQKELSESQFVEFSGLENKYGENNFNLFIKPIPENVREKIVSRAESRMGNNLKQFFNEQHGKYPRYPIAYPLALIGKAYNVETYYSGGSLYFYSPDRPEKPIMLQGVRKEGELQMQHGKPLLQLYNNPGAAITAKERETMIPIMLGSYKIHLMPKKEDRLKAIITLLDAIDTSDTLKRILARFKIAIIDKPYKQIKKADHSGQNAVVVIYPADKKENAQTALNEVYRAFKNFKGTNVRPRYNAKVTDLIWVAQGDGDAKDGNLRDYFDKNLIYYNPEKFGMPNIDVRLKHPETGKDLIDIK